MSKNQDGPRGAYPVDPWFSVPRPDQSPRFKKDPEKPYAKSTDSPALEFEPDRIPRPDSNAEFPPIVTIDGRVDTDIDHLIDDKNEDQAASANHDDKKYPKPHMFSVIDGSIDDDVDSLANHDGTMEHTLVDAPHSFNKNELKDVHNHGSSRSPMPLRKATTKQSNENSQRDCSHNKQDDEEVGEAKPNVTVLSPTSASIVSPCQNESELSPMSKGSGDFKEAQKLTMVVVDDNEEGEEGENKTEQHLPENTENVEKVEESQSGGKKSGEDEERHKRASKAGRRSSKDKKGDTSLSQPHAHELSKERSRSRSNDPHRKDHKHDKEKKHSQDLHEEKHSVSEATEKDKKTHRKHKRSSHDKASEKSKNVLENRSDNMTCAVIPENECLSEKVEVEKTVKEESPDRYLKKTPLLMSNETNPSSKNAPTKSMSVTSTEAALDKDLLKEYAKQGRDMERLLDKKLGEMGGSEPTLKACLDSEAMVQDSLKIAMKVAKRSMSAALKVAEALTVAYEDSSELIDKASTGAILSNKSPSADTINANIKTKNGNHHRLNNQEKDQRPKADHMRKDNPSKKIRGEDDRHVEPPTGKTRTKESRKTGGRSQMAFSRSQKEDSDVSESSPIDTARHTFQEYHPAQRDNPSKKIRGDEDRYVEPPTGKTRAKEGRKTGVRSHMAFSRSQKEDSDVSEGSPIDTARHPFQEYHAAQCYGDAHSSERTISDRGSHVSHNKEQSVTSEHSSFRSPHKERRKSSRQDIVSPIDLEDGHYVLLGHDSKGRPVLRPRQQNELMSDESRQHHRSRPHKHHKDHQRRGLSLHAPPSAHDRIYQLESDRMAYSPLTSKHNRGSKRNRSSHDNLRRSSHHRSRNEIVIEMPKERWGLPSFTQSPRCFERVADTLKMREVLPDAAIEEEKQQFLSQRNEMVRCRVAGTGVDMNAMDSEWESICFNDNASREVWLMKKYLEQMPNSHLQPEIGVCLGPLEETGCQYCCYSPDPRPHAVFKSERRRNHLPNSNHQHHCFPQQHPQLQQLQQQQLQHHSTHPNFLPQTKSGASSGTTSVDSLYTKRNRLVTFEHAQPEVCGSDDTLVSCSQNADFDSSEEMFNTNGNNASTALQFCK